MKTLLKITSLITLLISLNISAQNDKTILDLKSAKQSDVLTAKELMESVVFIQDFSGFQGKSSTAKPMTVKIVNYHPTKKLLPAYMINGIEYNDNGKFNDKTAGDGIFTSIKNVVVKGVPTDVSKNNNISDTFKYQSATKGLGGSFGCKVRTVTCPETSWWNTCWPLSSPCTCVEFYDCEFEISIE